MTAISVLILIVNMRYLAIMPYDIKKYYDSEDIRFFKSIGISFSDDDSTVDTFFTILPKFISIGFSAWLANVYFDSRSNEAQQKCTLTILHKRKLLNIAVSIICITSCIVQSVVQLVLFMACAFWMISASNDMGFSRML